MMNTSCLPSVLVSLFEQLPGCWGCKDTQSRFIHVNQAYCQLIGISDRQALIGRTDFELPGTLSAFAEDFQRQDRAVMATGEVHRVLNVHPYREGIWQAHVFTKLPWRNESGDIVGTLFYGQELNQNPMLEVGQWLCKTFGNMTDTQPTWPQSNDEKPISLSKRESEVLFFHLFGKKPQFISQALNVSVKTIENHFANVRAKLGAATKTELVDKALEKGVGYQIPPSLLTKSLTLVLS